MLHNQSCGHCPPWSPRAWSANQHHMATFLHVSSHVISKAAGRGQGFAQFTRIGSHWHMESVVDVLRPVMRYGHLRAI